jgi:hypothetical protein
MDGRVAELHRLERADEAVAAELAEAEELYRGVERVRTRALELRDLLLRLPEERAAAGEAVAEAERSLEEARRAHAASTAELETAEAGGDSERVAAARRFEVRARDHLHVREHAAELDQRADAADREASELEEGAGELAGALLRRPRLADESVAAPAGGLEGLVEWGTSARAALLVARSQLASERDAVVRQASELGTVLLGEELPSLTPAAVARRVEAELGAG